MKSVALYARVSSEQQVQQATIESQLAALRQRAESDGHVVLPGDEYVDAGHSGGTLVRPALEQLRDRVAQEGLDLLYVHAPDRLARRYAYQVLLLEELRACGTCVVFLCGPTGESAEDELLVQVQGMIAEYERAKILERSRRGKLHRARQGSVNPMSGAPYGYLYVKKTDDAPACYQILLHEAKVVRWMFESLVHEQKSIGAIVRSLNERHVPTRRGAPRWDRATVWAILKNPAYKGKAAFGKTEAVERGKLLRPIRGKNPVPRHAKSTYRDKPQEEWIHINVPALVSAELFDAAAEQLERNKRLSQRNGRGKRYLLQGLVVCGCCGYAFYGKRVSPSAAKGKPRRYAYYRCVGSDAYRFAGGRICHNPQVRVDQLDDYVWESVRDLLQDPSRVMEEWSRRAATDGVAAELRSQRDEAARLVANQERSLRRLVDAYEAEVLGLPELTARSKRIRRRLDSAREELKSAESRLADSVQLREVIGRLETFSERVRDGLHKLNWGERQQLIRTLVARVEIDEDGATVVYRVPVARDPDSRDPGANSGPSGQSPETNAQICQLREGRALTPACQHRAWRDRGTV